MSEARRILLESLIVALVGAVVALMANFVSPRGLSLSRDYFPSGRIVAPPPASNAVSGIVGTNPPFIPTNAVAPNTPEFQVILARLRDKGIGVVDNSRASQLFHDQRREAELVVFIDARNEQHYQEGHIPGAYLFDHYRAENYLAGILPVCMTAQEIVVYCTGGQCEDSEFAAITLRDAAVSKEKLFVYPGGITEWTNSGLPLEIGPRKSGVIREHKK